MATATFETGTYEVFHLSQNRWIQFHVCTSTEDAKRRFQWNYGYWPEKARPVLFA